MKLTKFEQGSHSIIIFPFDGKHVSGALVQADSTYPLPSDNGVHIFLNTGKNLNQSLDRVKNAGGKVVAGKLEIDSGVVASIIDTEGNRVGLFAKS